MNKEEKIGMYTREEILDYMQDCEGSMLGRSMYDAVMSKIDTLQSQLDIANKKLDKIRKYVAEKLIYIDDCDDQETILSIITEDDIEKIIGGE